MVGGGSNYVVRDAGTPGRLGRVHQTYPYTLHGLLAAMDDARLRSYGRNPVVVAILENRRSRVIRRYEHGYEVPAEQRPPA